MTHLAPMIEPAMKSWVDDVFVPALVRQYIHEHYGDAGTTGATSGNEAGDAGRSQSVTKYLKPLWRECAHLS